MSRHAAHPHYASYASSPVSPMYDPRRPARTRPDPKPGSQEQCPPPCPSCGGLECLCRPRFFAGQLLTERDLNALQDYVVAKNRLHNRYVHGWGVVCGLEVVCHPCKDQVTVRPGYALSPCGDDIVVCRQEPVDVCDLIRRCRPRADECEDPHSRPTSPCPDLQEDWILAICYRETQSRGITPLRGGGCAPECSCAGSDDCGCGCGGSKHPPKHVTGGGCGCGGSGAYSGAPATGKKSGHPHGSSPRRTPAHCEPTVICEGFTFTAYKPTPTDPSSDRITGRWPDMGDMLNRIMACFIEFFERLPSKPTNATTAQLHNWCQDLKRIIIDFFRRHPTYDCLLDEFLQTLQCPDPAGYENNPAGYETLVENSLSGLADVAASFIRYCLCSGMLPPCPEQVASNCVPLATVTVIHGAGGCRIVRVCNWGPRTFALTWPQIRYWLSPLQIAKRLAEMMENLCCQPTEFDRQRNFDSVRHAAHATTSAPSAGGVTGAAGGAATSTPPSSPSSTASTSTSTSPPTTPFDKANAGLRLLMEALGNPGREVNPRMLFLGALGVKDAAGKPLLSDLELHHPAHFLLANQLVGPTLAAVAGQDSATLAAAMRSAGVTPHATPTTAIHATSSADIDDLRRTVNELRQTVRRQQREIDTLRNR